MTIDLNAVSGGVSDPLTIGSLYATNTIRNAGVEQIVSATNPETRINPTTGLPIDGSPLVVGDIWYDTVNLRESFWNGTYFLSDPIVAHQDRQTATTNAAYSGFTGVPMSSGSLIFLEFFTVSYVNPSAVPATDYYQINLGTRDNPSGGFFLRGTVNANAAAQNSAARGRVDLNLALTVGVNVSGQVTELAIQTIAVGSPVNTPFNLVIQYRRAF
jgi:hypothetical protein